MRHIRRAALFVVTLISGFVPGRAGAQSVPSDLLSVRWHANFIPRLVTCSIDEGEPDDLFGCAISGITNGLHGGFPILRAVNMRENDGSISDTVVLLATQFGPAFLGLWNFDVEMQSVAGLAPVPNGDGTFTFLDENVHNITAALVAGTGLQLEVDALSCADPPGGTSVKLDAPVCGAVVPEPSTLLLVATGLSGLLGYAARHRHPMSRKGIRA
jgi:hypothetical protein